MMASASGARSKVVWLMAAAAATKAAELSTEQQERDRS